MTASHAGDAPRNAWQLAISRDFGTFFVARLATAVGTWLFSVTAMVAAFEASQSALLVGVVSAVQFTPQIVFAPLAGSWTDRGSVKLQLILGRSLVSAGALALAAWYWIDPPGGTGETAAIVCASLLFGMGLVIGGPALQTAGPELVSRAELPAAMSLSTAPMTVGRIAGPALGAVAAAWVGYDFAFAVAGALSVVFIVLVAMLRFPRIHDRRTPSTFSMREAFRFLAHDRPALLCLIGVTAVGVGSEPLITLAPALVAELGGDSRTVGALVAAMGLGAGAAMLVSSALARRLQQERVVAAGILVMAAALLACAVPAVAPWALVPFAAAGVGFIIAQAALSTILQLRIPPILRGRVMALWLIGFVGSRPIGALLVGAIADLATVYAAFAAGGAAMLVAATVCRPSRLRSGG